MYKGSRRADLHPQGQRATTGRRRPTSSATRSTTTTATSSCRPFEGDEVEEALAEIVRLDFANGRPTPARRLPCDHDDPEGPTIRAHAHQPWAAPGTSRSSSRACTRRMYCCKTAEEHLNGYILGQACYQFVQRVGHETATQVLMFAPFMLPAQRRVRRRTRGARRRRARPSPAPTTRRARLSSAWTTPSTRSGCRTPHGAPIDAPAPTPEPTRDGATVTHGRGRPGATRRATPRRRSHVTLRGRARSAQYENRDRGWNRNRRCRGGA